MRSVSKNKGALVVVCGVDVADGVAAAAADDDEDEDDDGDDCDDTEDEEVEEISLSELISVVSVASAVSGDDDSDEVAAEEDMSLLTAEETSISLFSVDSCFVLSCSSSFSYV